MAGLSPTQRTFRHLRQQGMLCGSVERWVPTGGKMGFRKDLFGFIDIIAIDALSIVAVQSCGQNYAEHERKILDSECTANAIQWLEAGGRIQLWGWRKVKMKRGGKAMRWSPRVREFETGDFGEQAPAAAKEDE